jgi:hypothetical protein
VTQETGFSNILPVGSGLFGWSTIDDICEAVDVINADPERASRAAREIAAEWFDAERVLQSLVERAGL